MIYYLFVESCIIPRKFVDGILMEPQIGLLSPSSHSIATIYRNHQQASPLDRESPTAPLKRTFPSSGFMGDELLNLAYEKGIIGSQGRVQDDLLFDLKENLQEEIQAVAARLQKADQGGEIFSNNPSFKAFPISFLSLIYRFQKLLGESTSPEIIGGAVSYLLGERFFISYALKRFEISEEEANRLLEPVLRLVRKPPADIDCRQYIRNAKKMKLLDDTQFKTRFSELLTTIITESTGNHYIDSKIIKNAYFQKLNLAKDETKRFGMGRFGKFLGGFPLEYLIVDQLPKPYISFHKSLALEIHPPKEPHGRPRVGLKFYTKSLASADILPETTLFQQIAMVLDSNDVSGIDWRGFLSMMAEATRASYRTLTPQFFDELWKNFKEAQVDLAEKMQWAAENHLLNRGGSPESDRELISSFYLNICIYLIEREEIDEDKAQFFLGTFKGLCEPLNFLQKILQMPGMELKKKLAWFKIGLWLRMDQWIPEGGLSTNYGTLCFRIINPVSQSVVWIPADLQNACRLAMASLREQEMKNELFVQLLFLTMPSPKEQKQSPYRLSDFNPWIDLTSAKSVAHALRSYKDNPYALKIALKIDLARCSAGVIPAIPLDWFKVLPEFLRAYPEDYAYFHPLFTKETNAPIQVVPKIETIVSNADWIAYLIRSGESEQVDAGLSLYQDMPKAESQTRSPITDAIETLTLKLLKDKLGIECSLKELSWVLAVLTLGGGNKSCALQINKDLELVLTYGLESRNRSLPILRTNIIAEGIDFFNNPENQDSGVHLFLQIFPDFSFDMKPLNLSGEEKKSLNQFARALLKGKRGTLSYLVGLKIFLIQIKHENSLSITFELLKLYPDLHKEAPKAGVIMHPALAVEKDQGSKVLGALLRSPNPFDGVSWNAALLLHHRKQCVQLGEELFRDLNPEQQKSMWQELYPQLLEYRIGYIPKALALFKDLSISFKSDPHFFLKWIAKVRNPKNEKANKELQAYLKEHQPELLTFKELKNHKGSTLDWLAKATQVIEPFSRKPEVTLLEQMTMRLKEARAMRDTPNDEDFAKYFLALEIPSHSREDYERLVHPRFDQLYLDLISKIRLFVKYRYTNGKEWLLIFEGLDQLNLWDKSDVRDFFVSLLSKENRYGSFFWKNKDLELFNAWQILIKKYLTDDKIGISIEVMREIIYDRFPVSDPWIPLNDPLGTLRATFLLNHRVQLEEDLPLSERMHFVSRFIEQCASWKYGELVRQFDEFFYCYSLVNRYFWNTHGKQLIDAVRSNDPVFQKTELLTTLISLIFDAGIHVDLKNGLSAVELLKDLPAVSKSLQCIFEVMVTSHSPIVVEDAESTTLRFAALLKHFQYDQFPTPQELHPLQPMSKQLTVEARAKFRYFKNILDGLQETNLKLQAVLLNAMHPKGWLNFLKLFLVEFSPSMVMSQYLICADASIPNLGLTDRCDFVRFTVNVFAHFLQRLQKEDIVDFLKVYYHSSLPMVLSTTTLPFLNEWDSIRRVILLTCRLQMDSRRPAVQKHYFSDLMRLVFLSESAFQKWVGGLSYDHESSSILEQILRDWDQVAADLSKQERQQLLPVKRILEEQLKSMKSENDLKFMNIETIAQLNPLIERCIAAAEKRGSDLNELVVRLETGLDIVSEKSSLHEFLGEFRAFYKLYYATKSIQQLRASLPKTSASREARRLILLALINSLHFEDDQALLYYCEDIRDIFIDLFLSAPEKELRQPEMTMCFHAFLQKACFSFTRQSLANALISGIFDIIPNPKLFGTPLMSIKEIALTMRVPLSCYDIKRIGEYLQSLVLSEDLMKVNRGLNWLYGLMEPLNRELKFQEIEELLDLVLYREGKLQTIRMEAWMMSNGLSEWALIAIGCFGVFRNNRVKEGILCFLERYVSLYDHMKEIPKESQFIRNFEFMTMMSTMKEQGLYDVVPSACAFDYDKLVRYQLDKFMEEYYPQRKQLSLEFNFKGPESMIIGWASMLISAMGYGVYVDQQKVVQKLQEVRDYNRHFFSKLFDRAFHEQDRAFLEASLEACDAIEEASKDTSTKLLYFKDAKLLVQERLKKWEVPCGREMLARIDTTPFSDDSERLSFAKDAAAIFQIWFKNPPPEVTKEEVSLYFKQFIQFLTQKFVDKRAAGTVLRELVEAHPNPLLLNFSLKSLNAVNLCIEAPAADYLKKPEDLVNVSRTLYRYIHSKDPLVVDTGFYWLGSLMTKIKSYDAKEILSLVFGKSGAREHKFDCSNKGEIIIGPWMAAHGLTHFFMCLRPEMSSSVAGFMKETFKRYLALHKGIDKLSLDLKLRSYYNFFSLIVTLRERRSSPLSEVMEDFQFMAMKLEEVIFEWFLPNREEIQAKHLFNGGDVNRKIIELGTWMIECISLGKTLPGDFLSEMFMRSIVRQNAFHSRLLKFAAENGDIELMECHLETLSNLKKNDRRVQNAPIPYDGILWGIQQHLDQLKLVKQAGYSSFTMSDVESLE